jgi:hypothetical protein
MDPWNVYMCICMHACMHVCMYVCTGYVVIVPDVTSTTPTCALTAPHHCVSTLVYKSKRTEIFLL